MLINGFINSAPKQLANFLHTDSVKLLVSNRIIILFLLIFIGIGHSAEAQKVRVLKYNKEYEKYRVSKYFDYLLEDFNEDKVTWVADYKVSFDTVIPGMIWESYQSLKEKANQFGANGFRVKDSDVYTPGQKKHIEISVYWIKMENRNENLTLHQANKVYLFGFLGHHQEIEGYDIKIQEDRFVMHSLSYKEFSYPIKTDVEVQLGTKSRGKKVYFKMEERMFPKHYYFNMVKGSFKNAWIDEYGLSFGIFLTNILRKE